MKKLSDKPPYRKWVGVLLGYLIPGSVHFLSGERSAGIKWLAGLFILGVVFILMGVIPGQTTYIFSVTCLVFTGIAFLLMLKQSCRPVRRIGFKGWFLVIIVSFIFSNLDDLLLNQFVQPFKVPTGAMRPTIMGKHGIPVKENVSFVRSFVNLFWNGGRFLEVYAKADGILKGPVAPSSKPGYRTYLIAGQKHSFPADSDPLLEPGGEVKKGDLLWRGFDVCGDHVAVEKVSYRFRSPRRGEIVVFKTDGIKALQGNTVYVKRLVGLPGETISIKPPFLYVNGKKVVEPEIFNLISSKGDGYSGFMLTGAPEIGLLNVEGDKVTLGEDEYFVLGDNSGNSYDSRYWGSVPGRNIIGRVTRIYWPFSRINALEGKQ